MTKDKALKMALEALEYCWSDSYDTNGYKARELSNNAITTIKEALAQRTWQGLTDEEIDAVTDLQWAKGVNKPIYAAHRAYARAIEAKLKEKNSA